MRWLLALWLAIAPAWAQEPIIGSGVYAAKSSATYTGPGDIVSGAQGWWGLRAYSAAVAAAGTQKAINIRNTGTNETCDVLIATTGSLASTVTNCSGSSSGNALSTFCGTCTVTKAYDQSGSGSAYDVSNATGATQPTLTLSCINTLPCIFYNGDSFNLTSGTVSSISSPQTASGVWDRTNAAATNRTMLANTNTLFGNGAANIFQCAQASTFVTASAADNANHSTTCILNGASSGIYNDGTFTSGSTTGRATGTSYLMGSGGPVDRIGEIGVWGVAFTGTTNNNSLQTGLMCANHNTFWGLSLTC